MVKFYNEALKSLKEGVSLADIRTMSILPSLLKAKFEVPDDQIAKLDELTKNMDLQFEQIRSKKEEVELIV
jgi:V/A-type H+-transporting ATPase subunit A